MSTETRTRSPELDAAFDEELEAMALQVAEPVAEPREPGLPRYARFQALDFLKHRAVLIFPVAMIALYLFHHFYDPARMAAQVAQSAGGFIGSRSLGHRSLLFSTELLSRKESERPRRVPGKYFPEEKV